MQPKQAILQQLNDTVQYNCHVADASHAGDYTLCIYLLKMRELYRWENEASFANVLQQEQVAGWLRQREDLWEKLQDNDFKNLLINELEFLPFESSEINSVLKEHNLVYSGGLGLNNRPHFFLAELEVFQQHEDYDLYIVGKEYARDMAAPPAMSVNNTIFIRKESFRRLLWEKLETWRWNRPNNALGRAFACYDCETNLEQALNEMCDCEVKNVIQHEYGEIKAGKLLGSKWEELLFELPHSKLSLYLRALRDMLADHLTTLPSLLEQQHAPSLHFYFGNLTNLRKDLAPQLIQAYQDWFETGSFTQLQFLVEQGQKHWAKICRDVLQFDQPEDKDVLEEIQQLIEDNRL
jgi:hypothetical protein